MAVTLTKSQEEVLQALREKAQAARQQREQEASKAPPAPVDPNAERWKTFMASGVDSPIEAKELERQEKEHGPGIVLGRVVRAIALAHLTKDFSREAPAKMLHDVYRDKASAQMMLKALSVGTPSEGGYFVPQVLGTDVVPLLRAKATILKLGAREVPMPNGNLTLPRITAGATFTYKAEGAKILSSQPGVGDVKWSAKKLTGNIPISNDLLKVQSVEADRIVRDDSTRGFAVAYDNAGLNAAGNTDEPLGVLKDGDTTSVAIAALVDGDFPTKFLTALLNANVEIEGGMLGWAFNPTIWEDLYNLKTTTGQYLFRDEMKDGKLLGYQFGVSSQITNGADANKKTSVAFGDWSEYLIARQGQLEIAVSNEAGYYDADGNIQLTWGKDQTVMRFIDKHDMRMRQAKAMAVSKDVYTQ